MLDIKEVLWLQEKVIALQHENIELKAIAKFGGFKAGTFKGRKLERERIIKLLEAEQLHDPDVVECHCGSWREAIALIKGEEQVSDKRKIQPDPNPYIKWWL